ncbi:MAG: hypothetical protein AMJ64_15535 [Betaproteobacteria bacterium SG8_39]|nr:MAG: hypothetical protein AMJ64_15535 [Betaproteobacteria bacterium SG8_39]
MGNNPDIPGDTENYATCSGWSISGAGGLATVPSPFTPASHANAPYGSGKFWFKVEYKSTAPIGCEDANAGIGNNCGTFTDLQNKKHQPIGIALTGAAKRSCETTPAGAKLTYTFACADGVGVDGYLTLVKQINGAPQPNPSGAAGSFTNCNAERIAAGECTMQYGGIPQKLVTKGKNSYYVIDTEACKAAFPGGVQVDNALNSGQTQPMVEGQILQYTEVASGAICDTPVAQGGTGLPVFEPPIEGLEPPNSFAKGTPTEAYGRYCQSDVDLFSNNLGEGGTIFGDEATSTKEGFDNVLRICPVAQGHYHTGSQDVEKVGGTIQVAVQNQPNMNIACNGNETNDNGIIKVWIPNQTASNVALDNSQIKIAPLSAAPKLYVKYPLDATGTAVGNGAAPISATPNVVLGDGRYALELKYRRCSDVGPAIDAVYDAPTSPVTLIVKGETTTGAGLSLAIEFTSEFNININW